MKMIFKNILILNIIALIIFANFSFFEVKNAFAAINQQINYQGRLLDSVGDPVADGGISVEFKLYTTATLGTEVWSETQTATTTDGLFSVMLGSVSPLDDVNFNQTLYLGINVAGDGEMTPRKVLGSVPSAFEAGRLNGVSADQFLRNDILNSTNSATTSFSLLQEGAGKIMELFRSGMNSAFSVLSNGNVGIGTGTPSTLFEISGNNPVFTITNTSGASDDYQIRTGIVSDDTFEIYNQSVGETMFSLDQDMVMVGTSTNILGNSSRLFVWGGSNGANIDVMGEAVSGRDQSVLELQSANFASSFQSTALRHFGEYGLGTTLGFANNSGVGVLDFTDVTAIIKTTFDDPLIFGTDDVERMRISGNGNVGIGTTTPDKDLVVDGDALITGALYDSTSLAGVNGYVLQTTGTGTQWVATSSLGIVGGITDYGIGDDVTSGTQGSVLFVDASGNLAQDNSNFAYDTGNGQLIINNSSNSSVVGNNNTFHSMPIYSSIFGLQNIFNSGNEQMTIVGNSNDISSGSHSTIIGSGNNSYSSDSYQTVVGYGNTSGGASALSVGFSNTANNAYVVAVGSYNSASGVFSVAVGTDNISSNNYSSALGYSNIASGLYSTAVGFRTRATASGASVFGGGATGLSGTMINSTPFSTMIGPSATSSIHIFGSTGEVKLPYLTATSTTSSSTLPLIDTTDISIAGRLYDSNSLAGVSGYVLQTTGTGTQWVATSSLGIVGGITDYGIGDAVTSGTAGSVLFVDASGNLAQDNTAFYWDATNDRLGIGTSTPSEKLSVVGNGYFTGDVYATNLYQNPTAISLGTAGNMNVAVGNSSTLTLSAGNSSSIALSTAANSPITFTTNGTQKLLITGDSGATPAGTPGVIVTGHGSMDPLNVASSTGDSLLRVTAGGSVGVGTTSPAAKFAVEGAGLFSSWLTSLGEVTGNFFTATSPTATSTLPKIQTTDINIAGRLYDSNSLAGVNGYVLQTTGTGTQWVATSTLGFSPGATVAGSDRQIQFNDGGALGADSGLVFSSSGNLGVGTSTPSVKLSVGGDAMFESFTATSPTATSTISGNLAVSNNLRVGSGSTLTINGTSISSSGGLSFNVNGVAFNLPTSQGGADTVLRNDGAGNLTWVATSTLGVPSTVSSEPTYAVGSVSAYSGSTLPDGWFWADGSAVSRTTYSDLFDLIGTTYGAGDGSTTFNLPDLRGRVVAGKDNMNNTVGSGGGDAGRLTAGSKAGVDGDTLGASGGVQQHLLTSAESGVPAHDHPYFDRYNSTITRQNGTNNTASISIVGVNVTTGENDPQDAAEAHTNVQPTIVLNYIIRYTEADSGGAFWTKDSTDDDLYYVAGNVGIGTSTPQRLLHVYRSTDGPPVRFQDSNGYCEINPTSTSWTCTSDERLKENITTISNEEISEKMKLLRPVTFEWKTDTTNEERIGFIAQEVEAVFPEFVKTDSETGLKSVAYGAFIPYIVATLQDIIVKLEALTLAVEELTNGGLQAVGGVIKKLTVGSSEEPAGITLFDEVTGDPYCLSVKNGDIITRFGECSEVLGNSGENPQITEESGDDGPNYITNIEQVDEPGIDFVVESGNSGGEVIIDDVVVEQESPVEEVVVEEQESNGTETIVETNSASGNTVLEI